MHTLKYHHKTVSSKQIVKIHYSSLLSISSDHNLKTYIQKMIRHLSNELSHIFASASLLVSVSAEHCMFLWSIPELTAFRKSLFPC